MNALAPVVQRAPSAMSNRKRLAAESTKKPKVVFPTFQQPESQDRVPTMSVADSSLLQLSLQQSRQTWTQSAFSRFIPEPAARGPGGKKYASEVTLAGHCTVCIGPHMFLDTKFFSVYNPPPPPSPTPASSSAPISAPTTTTTGIASPTLPDETPPSPTPSLLMGSSPAPERVIELIMARTAGTPTQLAMDWDGAEVAPGTGDGLLDTLSGMAVMSSENVHAPRDSDNKLKAEPTERTLLSSRAATPTPTSTKIKTPAPRPLRPSHQVAFEFKENPGIRWLFPQEASLEFTPAEEKEPARISASFYITVPDDARQSTSSAGLGQATTMVILQSSAELWEALEQAVNDSSATYRAMMDKMKHAQPRSYVQYRLPLDFPDEQLEPMGLKKLPDHHVVTIESIQPPKRRAESNGQPTQSPTTKPKRSKVGQDDGHVGSSSRGGTHSRRGATNPPPVTPPQKRCAYCECTSTPMWRRGPLGPSTLCNACGVKWKNGKILNETAAMSSLLTTLGGASASASAYEAALSALTTTAEAATRMIKHSLGQPMDDRAGYRRRELGVDDMKSLPRSSVKRSGYASRKLDLLSSGEADGHESSLNETERNASVKKRHSGKATSASSTGPKMVPIHQIGGHAKLAGKTSAASKKEPASEASTVSHSTKDASTAPSVPLEGDLALPVLMQSTPAGGSASSPASTGTKLPNPSRSAGSRAPFAKAAVVKVAATAPKTSKTKANVSSPPTTKPSLPTSAGAKLSLLKSYANTPKYHVSHPAAVPTVNLADDGLSLYATKNLYTNNTATFPLHFPTISIAFGPNNAYYTYPNCAVVLFENHFQIKLIQGGERTEIDVWKEGIEGTEFHVVDVGDGESMIVLKALLRQYLTRFDKELLNPDRNETLIVFRFRERLDGGGPPVKPLLEQWLTTEIPVPPSAATSSQPA